MDTVKTSFLNNSALSLFSLILGLFLVYIFFSKRNKNEKLSIATKEFIAVLVLVIFNSILEMIIPVLYYKNTSGDLTGIAKILSYVYVAILYIWNSIFAGYSFMLLKKNKKFITGIYDWMITAFVVFSIGFAMFVGTIEPYGGFNGAPFAIMGTSIYYYFVYTTIGSSIIMFMFSIFKDKIKNIHIAPLYIAFVLNFVIYVLMVTNNYYINFHTAYQLLFTIVIFFTIESQDNKFLEEYELATKQAQSSNKKAMDFLINMSHEIRSPMSSILGFSDLIMRQKELDFASVKSDTKLINEASVELIDLLGNISDISKLESNIETVNQEEYKIENILFEISSVINSKIKDELKFILNVNENIPKEFEGDPYKIYKVISDIIITSIKDQTEGEVILNITGQLLENNYYNFDITITNSNMTLTPEKFKENITTYKDGTYKLIDIKLGYIIAQEILDIMYGSLEYSLNDRLGKFNIQIPQKVINREPIGNLFGDPEVRANRHKILNCAGLKVLIVDDTQINIKFAKSYLSRYNFEIYTAKSGNECVELVKNNKFDLIFLDYMMPDMNGGETIKALDATGLQLPPIIALTANNFNGFREECIEKGYTDYLQKPIDERELNKLINRIFKEKE